MPDMDEDLPEEDIVRRKIEVINAIVACAFVYEPLQRTQSFERLKTLILKNGWVPEERVDAQIAWFYNELGIDDVYFQLEAPSVIADHITSLYTAKVAVSSLKDKCKEIRLDIKAKNHAIYIDTSEPGKSAIGGPRFETRLETKYLDGNLTDRFRVETFPISRHVGRANGLRPTSAADTLFSTSLSIRSYILDFPTSYNGTRLINSDRKDQLIVIGLLGGTWSA
ncbi:hypothetical protein F5883DRAFT_682253 [Diaporthe sp. PMI_573]|nr:hypothetical protein F5883DRAFT_682253 [Diaporthaceae sp. PMI_573]